MIINIFGRGFYAPISPRQILLDWRRVAYLVPAVLVIILSHRCWGTPVSPILTRFCGFCLTLKLRLVDESVKSLVCDENIF
jgi:Na+-translocating ferredoxin:NAD+ oxidoreductase RnfD subunit